MRQLSLPLSHPSKNSWSLPFNTTDVHYLTIPHIIDPHQHNLVTRSKPPADKDRLDSTSYNLYRLIVHPLVSYNKNGWCIIQIKDGQARESQGFTGRLNIDESAPSRHKPPLPLAN